MAGILGRRQSGPILGGMGPASILGMPSFATMYPEVVAGQTLPAYRPSEEQRAAMLREVLPDLAPVQMIKGAARGVGNLVMQANEAMPWGGNDPSAVGLYPDGQAPESYPQYAAGGMDPNVMVPFAADTAGLATTGGLSTVGMRPTGVGIFGGRLAKTADLEALARAEQMAEQGASRDSIWHATGWFQGGDGEWRFEIPDGASRLNPNKYGAGIPEEPNVGIAAGQLWHQDLYDAYPSLGMMETTVKKGGNGGRYAADGTIEIRPENAATGRSVALHEMQHAVQQKEGFSPGGSMNMLDHPDPKVREAVMMEADRLAAEQPSISYDEALQAASQAIYRRLAGEVEARNVQKRMNMSVDQRSELPPWWTQEVPDTRQIVSQPLPPVDYYTGERF